MALELGMPIKAAAINKHLVDADNIKGGYCGAVASISDRDDLPVASATQDGIVVVGSLVYCLQEQEMYICTAISLVDNEPVATWMPYVSSSAVDPMVWMGTLGSSGATISSLPDTSSSNKGYVYKVVTDGTYTYNTSSSVTVKVGDTLISTGTEWVVIPSGDEPTYQSLSESQNSSEVSLVTRGEKYTWNHKSTLALGTSSTTAFRGDYGNTAYTHSQSTHAPTTSSAAVSGGTTLSLVTTGEKYTWNNKSNLTIGTTSTTAAAGNHNHDGTYLKSVPAASQTVRGGAKIYASGDVVYITTT